MPLVTYTPELREGLAGTKAAMTLQLEEESVVLMPGANQVNPTVWKGLVEHPVHSERLEYLRDLRIIQVEQEDLAKTTLTSMSVQRAVAVVKETFDPTLLQAWLNDDGRTPVIRAIQQQQATLTPPTKEEVAALTAAAKGAAK